MSVNAWAFLVSRNQYLDYRTVIAPDFICQANISNLLARATDGDISESMQAYFRTITGSKAGDFSIIFRVANATRQDLSSKNAVIEGSPDDDDTVLKDSFGREIYLVKGVVLNVTNHQEEISLSSRDIEQVHQSVSWAYKQFWQQEKAKPSVPSSVVPLQLSETSAQALTLEILPPLMLDDAANIPGRSLSAPPAQAQARTPLEQDASARNVLEQNATRQDTAGALPAIAPNHNNSAYKANSARFPLKLAVAVAGLGTLVLMAIALITIVNPFARSSTNLCTTVQSQPLILEPNSNFKEGLSALQKQHHNRDASIFISGLFQLEPNSRLLRENGDLRRREPLLGEERAQVSYFMGRSVFRTERSFDYTLVLRKTVIRMEDHPLDLAIAQLGNQTVTQLTYLQVRTIVRQDCERR